MSDRGGLPLPERVKPLLEGTPIAFMTTMRPDQNMSTNPVALMFDGKTLRVSSVASRKKVRNLTLDDRITVCVVQPTNLNRYVEIRGRAIVEPDTDRSFVDTMAMRFMGADRYPFDQPDDERVVITVLPEQISCPDIPLADDPPYL